MTARSNKMEVRNPILNLRSVDKLRSLPPEVKGAMASILADLAIDARERAEESWRSHKAPMAAYWKAVSVYAGHIKRAIQK